MREISTKFLEVGEHIVVDGVEYVAEEEVGDCKDCDLFNCGRCFLIPCQNGVRLKRVEVPTNGGWHTGTPTEKGWYLLKLVDEYGHITYAANYLRKGIKCMEWKYAFFGHVIIKWQSIEDEPEVMMG